MNWRELSGVICDKKIPTKLKLLIYQTVIRPTLLYGCETWPMSVKDEKRMATTEMRMVRWAMGVSLLEHRRNEEILEEAKVEAIATVMRRRRLEWFGHVKRRGETENIRAVAEMKMEGKRPRGRPKLRWKDTIRRDLKAWKIKEEWATDREKWKGLCKTRYPEQGDGGERWERWEIEHVFTFHSIIQLKRNRFEKPTFIAIWNPNFNIMQRGQHYVPRYLCSPVPMFPDFCTLIVDFSINR